MIWGCSFFTNTSIFAYEFPLFGEWRHSAPPKKLHFPTSENRHEAAQTKLHMDWGSPETDPKQTGPGIHILQTNRKPFLTMPNLSSTILQVEMHTISGWWFPPWRKSSTSTGMISAGGAPLMQFSLGTISFAWPIAWYGSRMGHLKMTKHELPDLVVPMSLKIFEP